MKTPLKIGDWVKTILLSSLDGVIVEIKYDTMALCQDRFSKDKTWYYLTDLKKRPAPRITKSEFVSMRKVESDQLADLLKKVQNERSK